MQNYEDSGGISMSQMKSIQLAGVENIAFYYSAATPITAQPLVRRTGGRRRSCCIAQCRGVRKAPAVLLCK